MIKSLEEVLQERNAILEDVLPELFKFDVQRNMIELIAVHRRLAKNPTKINNAKSIKVSDLVEEIYEKYSVPLEIVNREEKAYECPLSCGIIENKWVGECGHIFEENVVLEFLKKEKYCPVHGCSKILKRKQ